jgi:hypothetical protein
MGWTVKLLMVRHAHHERLNLMLSRVQWRALLLLSCTPLMGVNFIENVYENVS